LVKPVNGKGGKILRNRFFKKLLFVDYTLAAMNKYSGDMFFDIFEVSILIKLIFKNFFEKKRNY
jgi:hypothetical protein